MRVSSHIKPDYRNSSLLSVTWIVTFAFLLLATGCIRDDDETNDTVTDIDGNVYKTITIAGQTWMAENLRVTHYRDGSPLPTISDNREWEFDETGMCCDYKFIADNKRGKLYNWYAIEAKNKRRLAPEGWHIPTAQEWQALIDAMGDSYTAGYRLKDKESWPLSPGYPDLSIKCGFDAVPGGFRDPGGNFDGVGKVAVFWTSTGLEYFTKEALILSAMGEGTDFISYPLRQGFSVRCIKDQN